MNLGAVIVTHADGQVHPRSVSELERENLRPEQIVIVRNPRRHQVRSVSVDARGFTTIHPERNLGFGSALNVGVMHLMGRNVEAVLLMSDDVRLGEGLVESLMTAASEHPEVGLLAPASLFEDGNAFSYGGEDLPSRTRHRTVLPTGLKEEAILDAHWVTGTLWYLPRRTIERVGLIDERFFLYYEEPEYCLRILRAGMRVGVLPSAGVYISDDGTRRPGVWEYLYTRNGLEYARMSRGALGVFAYGRRALKDIAYFERLRRSTSPDATAAGDRRRGVAIGILHFAIRRWGAPPESVPGANLLAGT